MKQKQKIILGLGLLLSLFSFTFAEVFVSEDTSIWLGYTDNCASAENNHISITPTTIPIFWTGNTIYDFQSGTYNLVNSIVINEPCTALIGEKGVIINGNGSTVIVVSSNYNIIKNITINGNTADGISLSNNDSNTISNAIIYGSNRGILLTTAINTIIKDSKIFNNTIGISLQTNSNNNILNNNVIFNNSQNGIFINGGYRNTINNTLSFNNSLHGFFVQAGNQNIINNSIFYNNNGNGLRLSAGGNYISALKIFNNVSNITSNPTTGYNIIHSDVNLPMLKFGLSSDSILGTIGWQNGTITTGLLTSDSEILNPHDGTNYLIDISTATETRRGTKIFGDNFVVSSSNRGANVPNQIQPVQRNTSGTQLENSSISFSASKKIGEVVVTSSSPSGGGGGGSPSQPVCGNRVVETDEECDDGNKRNGDGCSFACTIEQPGICGNGKLEYMEECDDGNKKDGDGCSSICKIEGANLILSPKLLLQQKELKKTLGIPDPLINLKGIETTSDFILSTINQNQKQQLEQCQYTDVNYGNISFNDIKSQYQQQIETLLNYCIVQGKQIGNQRFFGPKDYTTYAEFIKVLVKAHFLGTSIDFHNNTFDIQKIYADVAKNTWYAPYIIKAYVHDLLIPIEKIINNKIYISPETNITRLDAVRLLINSLKLANKNPKNIEIITDTFQDANKILTREEMAALIVYGYELDYDSSLRIKSNNGILMKLLAEHIKKYKQEEQISILKNMIGKIEKINENVLKKINIHKKQLLTDIAILIDFSEMFLK